MSPQRLGFPQVSQGPWKSEAAPLPGITRRLLVVAAREEFTGGQGGHGSSPDPTRCQEPPGDEKEEATGCQRQREAIFPLLPSALLSLLAAPSGREFCLLVRGLILGPVRCLHTSIPPQHFSDRGAPSALGLL